MRHFHNILYVSHGTIDETEGLKQALSIARNNDARLKILVIAPELPKEFADYKQTHESSLHNEIEATIEATKTSLAIQDDAINVTIELATSKTPAIFIIQHVLQQDHDLVIKEVETQEKRSGFRALDMDLLRKCPTPVWLCRPIEKSRQDMKIAVAIDPETQEAPAQALSKRMLELSRSLADSCSGELHIISCWDYMFENYLRGNAWIKTADEDITKAVDTAQQGHRALLDTLIKESGISGNQQIHHMRGKPDEIIPNFVKNQDVDILIMGTVARTGIAGFMNGNTAENILQDIECSLMALKPQGFISPVKAFDS